MKEGSGTPLYLQVEDAIKEFQTGITKLKAQQTQTDALLLEGNQALENLVHQVARIDSMQDQVESDLRLLERFRESTGKEISALKNQVLSDLNSHEQSVQQTLGNIKTDISVRRKEVLGLIQDLRQNLQILEEDSKAAEARLGALNKHTETVDSKVTSLNTNLQTLNSSHDYYTYRLVELERRSKYLALGVAILLVCTILAILL